MVSLCGVITSACGNTAKGVELCKNAIRLSPRDPRLHMLFNNLWMAHWTDGDWDAVADAAMQSMRIRREGNPWAIVGLIMVNVARGENDLAVENARRLGSFNLSRFLSAAYRKDAGLSEAKQAEAADQWEQFKALGLVE
jgi:hypothetical protein